MLTTPASSPSQRHKFVLIGLFFLGIATICAFLWWQNQPKYTITITINGHVQEFSTNADTVGAALKDAEVLIDRADRIDPVTQTQLSDGMTITVTKARQLVLDDNGNIQRIYTHESTPYRILDEQGIRLGPNDTFFVNYRPANLSNGRETIRHLQITRAKRYQVLEDNIVIAEGDSTADTIGTLLAELDIPLYIADQFSPGLDQIFSDQVVIHIQRSVPVIIEADGKRIHTRAVGPTINDAVNSAGFPLSGQDYTIPSPNTPLAADLTIQIMRVLETVEEQHKPLPFRTLFYPMPHLTNGQQEVIQIGTEGIQATQVRVRYENGQVVSRIVSVPWIIQPPVHQIIAYGVQ